MRRLQSFKFSDRMTLEVSFKTIFWRELVGGENK